MNGEHAQDAQWRGEFDRIVKASLRDRPAPIGPYMRWPLGAALVLMVGQVFASGLDAVIAGLLLTGGHSREVTSASLWRTLLVTATVAAVLGWAAYNIRGRVLLALYVATMVEAVEVAGRTLSLVRADAPQVSDYLGLAWALAALLTLLVPSSRGYCTRRARSLRRRSASPSDY